MVLKQHRGFTLLELVVVFSLIAILFAVAAARYQSSIAESQKKVIGYQAGAFLRTIENIRAIATIQNNPVVDMGHGLFVYLNSDGWPIASNVDGNKGQSQASLKGCESLWRGLFSEVDIDSPQDGKSSLGRFHIEFIENRVCRYKLSRKQEGSYFFDYHVITGNVVITSNESN